jgi:TPR repeat protein
MRAMLLAVLLPLTMLISSAVEDNEISQLEARAEMGDPEAQNALGEKYYRGEGVEQNCFEAKMCFHRAAAQGHAKAQLNLGYFYDPEGNRCRYPCTDPGCDKEAEKWYRMAAEQGLADAQWGLAWFYMRGWGNVSNDETEIWLRKAAEQGQGEAQYNLGEIYLVRAVTGNGRKDYILAYMWLDLAVCHGFSYAANERDHAASSMTAEEIERAQELVRNWEPKKPEESSE